MKVCKTFSMINQIFQAFLSKLDNQCCKIFPAKIYLMLVWIFSSKYRLGLRTLKQLRNAIQDTNSDGSGIHLGTDYEQKSTGCINPCIQNPKDYHRSDRPSNNAQQNLKPLCLIEYLFHHNHQNQ